MAHTRLALAVIGDEIGPSLPEMISFCAENGVRRLDMRTVDGKNLLGMTPSQVQSIKTQLSKAGIDVPTFVSPVLKWTAPGKGTAAGGKVDFAFDPKECPSDDPLAHAFAIADALGARHMRVFSFLRYPGYAPQDIKPATDRLVELAQKHDVIVEMENEPVCNIGSVAELAAFFRAIPASSHLRPLVDIGNSWSMGMPPSDGDIGHLAPSVDLIHLKDRNFAARRTVPLGDGEVPWAKELTRLLKNTRSPEVLASMETHCPQDGRNATAKSVAALRRIADEIGVELV
jgi:sugar phosphate isomerase/epimerase